MTVRISTSIFAFTYKLCGCFGWGVGSPGLNWRIRGIQFCLHMATIYKKANSKYWYAQFYDSTGKRVSRSTGLEKPKDAKKAAEDFESEDRKRAASSDFSKSFATILETAARDADAGSLTLSRALELMDRLRRAANPDFKPVTVADAWKEWRGEQNPHIGASCARGYLQDEMIVVEGLGKALFDGPLEKLRDNHIQKALVKAASKEGRKAKTVNKAFSSFRRVLERATSKQLIASNPAKQVRSLPENDSSERGPFTAVEVRQLMNAAAAGNRQCTPENADEWSGAILIAAHTGLRMGDVAKLSSDHVDGVRFVIRPGKTKRSKKSISIPLSPPVVGWIGDRKGLFFPSIHSISSQDRSVRFAAIMKKAGVPKQVTLPGGIKISRSFHSLRHTFASWLAEADIHADVRQKLTGHSSSKIHQRYTHHDESLARAIKSLPEL